MSSVCDWARLDLCLKPQGPASLIKCMEDGCNLVLHHMCQCTWESEDEDVCQAHGTRKYCAHHHPAVAKGQYHPETGPPSNLLQGFSHQQLRQCPQLLLPHLFPPWGIYTLLINPYLLMDKKLFLIIKRMKMIMMNNFLPFNVFGIAPILKKSHWMEVSMVQ
jgi:hypothetical protein